jgi:CHAT domain-containing protein
MNRTFFFIFLTFFLVGGFSVFAQKKMQRKLDKIERKFQAGKIKKAYKKNEAFIRKMLRSGKKDFGFGATAYLNQGKLLLHMGRHIQYEKSLKEATGVIKRVYNDTGRVAYETYLGIAETYYQYGHYRKSLESLNQAKTIYDKSKEQNAGFLPAKSLLLARIDVQMGYLNKADSIVTNWLPKLENRIVRSEKGTDAKGRTKNIKVNSSDFKSRKQAYAWATSTKADIALQRGFNGAADSLYKLSNQWVDKNLGSSNPVKMQNLQSIANIEESKGNLRTATAYNVAALSAVKNRLDIYYFQGFDRMIYSRAIKDNFSMMYHKSLATYERKTSFYYDKENVFFANKELLEEWINAKKFDHNFVKERLNELMSNGLYIPLYSSARIKAQEIHVLLDVREGWLKPAEDTLMNILKVMKELYGDQTPAYHRRKLDLADFYLRKTNNLKKAEEIYLQSFMGVVSKEMSPRHEKYVQYLDNIGVLYALWENFVKSSEYLQMAEKQAKINFTDKSPKYALILGDLVNVYLELGKYTQAKQMFEQAESVLDAGNIDDYSPSYALAYQNIAEGYSTFGYFDKSLKNLRSAEKIVNHNAKKGYNMAENSSIDDLGAYYLQIGKYREAERILKQSIAEKEKLKSKEAAELIKPLNLLGLKHYLTGDYGQAEAQLNRAVKLSIKQSGDTTLRYAESLKTLRKLHSAFGDYQKAEAECKKQIDIITRIQGYDNINLADALVDLAIIRYNLGSDANDSRKMLFESNSILKKQLGSDNPSYINGLKTLAFFQMETNQLASADSLIAASEKYWETKLGKNNVYTPELDLMWGDLYRKQRKYAQALNKYEDALSLYKSKFSSQHPDYVKTLSRIAKTYYAKGDYKNSLTTLNVATQGYHDFILKYFPVLSFGEKSKYWETIKGDFEFFNSLALKMKDNHPDLIGQMYDYVLATKALLLSNSIKVRQRILSSGNPELIGKFNVWNDKKELYTQIISYSQEQSKVANVDPIKLEKEINDLEKELSATSEEFSKSFENRVYHWKDVRKSLKEKEAAIEIVRFRFYANGFTDSIIYAALIVTDQTSGNPDFVLLPNGNMLEKKYIKYYRNTIKYKNEDHLSYDVFWKPIESQLKGIHTIYLSSEGVYNQLNVETLQDDNDKYLIDKYDILLVSNTKDLALARIYEKKKIKKNLSNNISLVGNPQFYLENSKVSARTIPQLQGAEQEAKGIADLFTANKWQNVLLTDHHADEDKLKNMEGPRILHVATHGYFQPDQTSSMAQDENSMLKKNELNPLFRSGILLTGAGELLDNHFTAGNVNGQTGILTAYEAMNMNLDNTELVTLSACETGLGDVQIGEGVAGLQRSFLVAGADNVVMSLFKVDDEVTEKLMLIFYEKWLRTGDKRRSFIEAKKEIKADFPESVYWGSFIMIGVN